MWERRDGKVIYTQVGLGLMRNISIKTQLTSAHVVSHSQKPCLQQRTLEQYRTQTQTQLELCVRSRHFFIRFGCSKV